MAWTIAVQGSFGRCNGDLQFPPELPGTYPHPVDRHDLILDHKPGNIPGFSAAPGVGFNRHGPPDVSASVLLIPVTHHEELSYPSRTIPGPDLVH